MQDGAAFSQEIMFAAGTPAANVTWELVDGAGVTVLTGSFTPAGGAVSHLLTIPGAANTVTPGDLYAIRRLSWSYTVAGQVESGMVQYRIDAELPFGLRTSGVRAKLGVGLTELADEDIDLVRAYGEFRALVGASLLLPFEASFGYETLVIADAIEAWAARAVLPTMAVRVAKSESSGTNEFARDKIDWDAVGAQLDNLIAQGQALADPAGAADHTFFIVATRTDAVTGA